MKRRRRRDRIFPNDFQIQLLEQRVLLSGVRGRISDLSEPFSWPFPIRNDSRVLSDSEKYLDGLAVELWDSQGTLVDRVETRSIDINDDGSILPDTESGWYQFDDLKAGDYLIQLPGIWAGVQFLKSDPTGEGHTGKARLAVSLEASEVVTDQDFQLLATPFSIKSEDSYYTRVSETGTERRLSLQLHRQPQSTAIFNIASSDPDEFSTTTSLTFSSLDWIEHKEIVVTGLDDDVIDGTQTSMLTVSVDNGTSDEFYSAAAPLDRHVTNLDDERLLAGRVWFDTDNNGHRGSDEPWQNGRKIDLLDSNNQLIASTTSRNYDVNDDGEITPETESGWYRFENPEPGFYTIRQRDVALVGQSQPAWQEIQDVNVNGVTRAVYDTVRDVVYALSYGHLSRTSTGKLALGSSANLFGDFQVSSVDISQDNRHLFLGTKSRDDGSTGIREIDLQTNTIRDFPILLDDHEAGIADLAVAADGHVYFTSAVAEISSSPGTSDEIVDNVSSPEPSTAAIRELVIETGDVVRHQNVHSGSEIARSGDGSLLLFGETFRRNRNYFTFDVDARTFSDRTAYTGSDSLAVNSDGSLIAVGGRQVIAVGSGFESLHDFGEDSSAIVFAPIQDLLYHATASAGTLTSYDTTSFEAQDIILESRYKIRSTGLTVAPDGDSIFVPLSRDSVLLHLDTPRLAPGRSVSVSGVRGFLSATQLTSLNFGGKATSVDVQHSDGKTQVLESGSTDSFTVALNSRPESSVVLQAVSDSDEIEIQTPELVFTTDNWAVPQEVHVVGRDDDVSDGTQRSVIELRVLEEHSSLEYVGLPLVQASVTTLDDEVRVTGQIWYGDTGYRHGDQFFNREGYFDGQAIELKNLRTGEVFNTVSQTVEYYDGYSQEGHYSFDDLAAGEYSIRMAGLSIFGQVWPEPTEIDLAAGGFSKPIIKTLEPGETWAPSMGRQERNLSVSTSEISVNESGTTQSVDFSLFVIPDGEVVVNLTSEGADEVLFSPASLTFTPENWHEGQTVVFTGQDDDIPDQTQQTDVLFSIVPAPGDLVASVDRVSVKTRDNESRIRGRVYRDDDRIRKWFNNDFINGVHVELRDSTGIVATAVTGSLDLLSDGSVPEKAQEGWFWFDVPPGEYTIHFPDFAERARTTGATRVSAVEGRTITTNLQLDTSGFLVHDHNGHIITDSVSIREGGNRSFYISLTRRPKSDITLALSTNEPNALRPNPEQLTFTPDNWDTEQAFAVWGVLDNTPDSDVDASLSISIIDELSDEEFRDLPDNSLEFVAQNTNPYFTVSQRSFEVTERGEPHQFEVSLNYPPTMDTVISVNGTHLSFSERQLRFTSANWDVPQTVQFNAVSIGNNDVRSWINLRYSQGELSGVMNPDKTIVVDILAITKDNERPKISSPGAVVTPGKVIYWSEVPGVDSYQIWVEMLNATGENRVVLDEIVEARRFEIPQDFGFGKYRVWVRALIFDGTTSGWHSQRFAIGEAPTLQRETTTDNRNLVTWNKISGASHYRIFGLESGRRTVVDRLVDQTSFDYSELKGFSGLQFWVQAVDTSTGHRSLWSTSIYAPADSNTAPILLGPKDSMFDSRPSFRWAPVSRAVSYQVYVSRGSTVFINESQIETESFAPAMTLGPGKYRWWVRATDAYGSLGEWGAGQFIVGGYSEFTEIQNNDGVVELQWTPVAEAKWYDVAIYNKNLSRQLYRETGVENSKLSLPLNQGTYFAYTRNRSVTGGISRWSQAKKITVTNNTSSAARARPTQATSSTFETTPTLEWEGAADQFEIFLSSGSGSHRTLTEGTSWIPDTELQPGKWVWWVRGIDDQENRQHWSSQGIVHIGGRATGLSNLNGTVEWTSVVGASEYVLFVNNRSTGEIAVIHQDRLTDTTYATGLNKGEYRAWVRAIGIGGEKAPWSRQFDFEVV